MTGGRIALLDVNVLLALFDPDHVQSLVETLRANNATWAFSLRKIVDAEGRFIAFDNAFHGRTMGAVSLTGTPKYREGFGGVAGRGRGFSGGGSKCSTTGRAGL